jgi:hypothetical protein
MWTPNVTEIKVQHHRNGIGGEGFTAVTFTSTDKDDPAYDGKLIGIIPDRSDDEDQDKCDGRCYIVHSTITELCYRGDNFEPVMREILKAHDIQWRYDMDAGKYSGITQFDNMTEVRSIIGDGYKKREKPVDTKVYDRFTGIEIPEEN